MKPFGQQDEGVVTFDVSLTVRAPYAALMRIVAQPVVLAGGRGATGHSTGNSDVTDINHLYPAKVIQRLDWRIFLVRCHFATLL